VTVGGDLLQDEVGREQRSEVVRNDRFERGRIQRRGRWRRKIAITLYH
jgi:hypothetical protein